MLPSGGRPSRTPYFHSKCMTPECRKELVSRAENGSVTAQSFFEACEMVAKAMELLKQKQKINDAFKLIRLSLREWDLPILEFSLFYMECVKAAKEALDRNSQDADALYVLARLDMTQTNEEKLRMAKRCVELDPTVPDFHYVLACKWGFVDDHKNGLRAIQRAIELLPNESGWLYDRAGFIRLRDERAAAGKVKNIYSADAAEAYLKFLSSNPTDNRKFPDACYFLAHIYFLSGDKAKAKSFYQQGLDAEDPKIRLPCFEPVKDDFPAKMTSRMLLKAWEGSGKTAGPVAIAATPKETTKNCANCFKSNPSFRCTACKSVWYCDRACQSAHWKKHKVDCKRVNRC